MFIFIDCFFFKIPEIESLKSQKRPACKRKKPLQKQPVSKRIKTDGLIKEAPVVGLIRDHEDAEFIGGPIIKKSKEKKKG